MTVHYKLNDKVTLEVTGEEMTSIFEELARGAEVFQDVLAHKGKGDDRRVGNDVIPRVRTDKEENKYYELHSRKLGAKKTFGCTKQGGHLFPKLKDSEGGYLPDNGWRVWDKDAQKEV